jgi:hypothetical protein
MKRTPAMVLIAVWAVFGSVAMAEVIKEVESETPPAALDLTIDLPVCKRDMSMWKSFSPWHRLRQQGRSEEWIASLTKHWRKEDAVDVTWVDIDGDGWCDAITSGQKEIFKSSVRPLLLYAPRGIYLRTAQGFTPFRPGMITSEYEGSSFVVYWQKSTKNAVIVIRVYQGNLIQGLGGEGDEFHVRQMLRAAFAGHRAGNTDVENAYLAEIDPFFHRSGIPRPVVKQIWKEEAERAGVDLEFPYMDR